MKLQNDDGPLYLFRFDGQGKHSGKIEIADMDDCANIIEGAVKNSETITITDSGDDCVFRCERGKIAWPRLDKLFPQKDLDGEASQGYYS